MSVSCEYMNELMFRETLQCQFGCCEHGCCTEQQMNNGKLSPGMIVLVVAIPVVLTVLLYVIIYYCRQRHMKKQAALLQQLIEASRPRPQIILQLDEDTLQPRSPCEQELPVAQGPPDYQEATKPPPSFEEATRPSPGHGILGRGHSGYRRFENEM